MAGVDLDEADRLKERLRSLVDSTRTSGVRSEFGSFGGRFAIGGDILVASADGVGTKLKVAFRAGRHDTVGEDLVNHCINDILAEGASPLFFLDYFACGELQSRVALEVISGLARGCRENECALLGGETAEMPDFYAEGEYDLAGFVVGRLVFEEIARRALEDGFHLVALASSGLHTNGFSFARELIFERLGLGVEDEYPGADASVGQVLLRPHRSYLKALRGYLEQGTVHALAHVTGGGIPGNLKRILPSDLDARVNLASWDPPAEFRFLAERSAASTAELYRTFNMGVGMIAVCRPEHAAAMVDGLTEGGCAAWICGELVSGSGRVHLVGRT